MHRFVDDLPYGHLLRRFRNGELTIEDIKKLNERVYKGGGLPDGMQYASYRNRDRDIINALVFLKFCLDNQRDGIAQDAVAILMDDLKVKNGNNTYVPMRSQNRFFQNCMEDNLSCGSGDSTERLAPILYGMKDGPFMITYNKDVKQGQANGSCVFLEKVMLKAGESYSYITLDNGVKVRAATANQIKYLLLRHESDRVQPQQFKMVPKRYTFRAKMPVPTYLSVGEREKDNMETFYMQGYQFPLINNSATTGHKLQGKTVKELFVYTWERMSCINWEYVVLSRVKTFNGLYFKEALKEDPELYRVPESLQKFLDRMRQERMAKTFDEDTYNYIHSYTHLSSTQSS